MIDNSNNATDHIFQAQRLIGLARSVDLDHEYDSEYKAVLNADHISAIFSELSHYLLENREE